MSLQDSIRIALFPWALLLDLAHRSNIGPEVASEGCVDGGVVHRADAGVVGLAAEGHCHGDFGTHAVADEGGLLEGVGGNEGFDVGGHGGVVMGWGVWGVAVVAQVECVDGPGEVFGKNSRDGVRGT